MVQRVVLSACVLVLAFGTAVGHNRWAGPVLFARADRGLVLGDLAVVLIVLVALVLIWRRRSSPSSSPDEGPRRGP